MDKLEASHLLTSAQLREALDYDPSIGVFTWRHRANVPKRVNSRFVGKPAGCRDGQYGYISIRLYDRLFQAHRLAWLYMTGEWPVALVDHIDMNPANNSWANLRAATKAQNMMNQGRPSHNKTGFKGVSNAGSKWVAQIQVDGKNRCIGRFDTPEEAHEACREAATRLHGKFARFG